MNFSRSRTYAVVIFFSSLGLLVIDYFNFKKGLWVSNPSYKLLFISHVILGLCMLISLIIFWRFKPDSSSKINLFHHLFTDTFALTCLFIAAYVSGWIAQTIHGEITVYIFVCFSFAITQYLSPLRAFLIFGSTYIGLMYLLSISQQNSHILQGHYINATISFIICFVLVQGLFRMKVQDLMHQHYLEELVSERTSNLERVNQALEEEIDLHKQSAESLIQTSEKLSRLASIVENSEDGIIGMSLDGKIVDWNPGAFRIFGYKEDEIVGHCFLELFPAQLHELQGHIAKIVSGEPVVFETRCLGKQNDSLDVLATVSPIRNREGDIIGISAIVSDITANKKIQREMSRLQQLNLIGEMAASISHEVRNPMTTVKGFLQMLCGKEDCKQYSDYYDLMISEIDRANSIMSEFLALSKNKATEFHDCRLDEIAAQIMPLISANALQLDINVETCLEETPPIPLNENEIRQVILNLARNGLEAMVPGGILTLRTYYTADDVFLSVEDQGSGISADVLSHLGTPFFSTKDEGTGLGLAVCYGIVQRHLGKIDIQTNRQGSVFTISFPI